jgi:hypothetical protein
LKLWGLLLLGEGAAAARAVGAFGVFDHEFHADRAAGGVSDGADELAGTVVCSSSSCSLTVAPGKRVAARLGGEEEIDDEFVRLDDGEDVRVAAEMASLGSRLISVTMPSTGER